MVDITNNFMVKKTEHNNNNKILMLRFLCLVKISRVGVVSFLKFCLKNLIITTPMR